MTDPIDYSERSGFLSGKAAALADWRHAREKAQFAKLVKSLRAKNRRASDLEKVRLEGRLSARKRRAEDPERARAACRRWRARNRDRARQLDRAQKRRRRELALASGRAKRFPRVVTCEACGLEFDHDRPSRFCSTKCRNRWHAPARARAKNRGIRTMGLAWMVKEALRKEPGLSGPELVERLPGVKPASLATKLSEMTKAGELVHVGRTLRGYRYAPKDWSIQ